MRSLIYFALLGHPVIMLIKKTNADSSEVLKVFLNSFLKTLPKNCGKLISIRIPDITNMGKSDGKMFFVKRFILKTMVLVNDWDFINIFIVNINIKHKTVNE